MTTVIVLFIATVFLAYSNGSNDNFKGVATLFGSDTANYKNAIWWATITTFAGSVCSIFLAETLIKNFSGKGLAPDAIATSPDFLIAVALGAGCTVMLATVKGFPISTTHSLIGALAGTGFVAVGRELNVAMLGEKFFLPLLVSPLIAVILGSVSYMIFRCIRIKMGITKEWCLCAGETQQTIPIPQPEGALSFKCIMTPDISLDTQETCTTRYTGRVIGINVQSMLDSLHYFSAGVVSFARGLNDTPKIMALLIVLKAFDVQFGMLVVGAAMAIGGLMSARKVAETMSKKITPLNHGQGFTANLVTGVLVIFASRFGMPVSTTHVSVGSLFGLSLVTRKGDTGVITKILMSWILTLPVAAIISGFIYWISQ